MENRGGSWTGSPSILIQAECQFCGMIKAEEIAGSVQKEFQAHLGGRLFWHSPASARRFNAHPVRSRRGIPWPGHRSRSRQADADLIQGFSNQRDDRRSILVVTNLPFDEWTETFAGSFSLEPCWIASGTAGRKPLPKLHMTPTKNGTQRQCLLHLLPATSPNA